MEQINFYNPYVSESESESDSESDSGYTSDSSTSFSNSNANFVQLAQNLLLTEVGNPSLPDISGQVHYSRGANYSLYNSYNTLYSSTNQIYGDSNALVLGEPTITSVVTQVTSIINLDSTNRDKRPYPQPTNLELRLPRTYKDIQNFQIVQIKLLSAFYYFRKTKQNLDISINEQSRYLDADGNVVVGSNSSQSNILNTIKNSIREGSYDINSLINELTIQLNTPPIFYDFFKGFDQFVPLFASSGDFSAGFNLPGDYYYDSVINEYIVNPTIEQIVTKYFQSRYAGLTSYTIDNIKIAYYYPVLKEALLDNNYSGPPIDFTNTDTSLLLPGETPYTRCVFHFQGIFDSYVLDVIQLNLSTLDTYRLKHTFRYSLVNKYNVYNNAINNHIYINTPSLNTSLVNLLNSKQTQYFNTELHNAGITASQYSELFTQNTLYLAILTDMYTFLQQQFALGFAVNFNTFTLDYFANSSNYIYLRNGSNSAVSSNYDTNVISQNITPLSNNITTNYQQPPNYVCPNLATNASSNFSSFTNINYINNQTFNLQTDSIESQPLVDINNNIYCSKLLNHVDTITNINNTSYSVFKFKSSYRQTLQVETLPRPTKYRYPEYNTAHYSPQIQNYFNNLYTYEFNQSNTALINTSYMYLPGFSNLSVSNFGISLTSSIALWSNSYASISAALPYDTYAFIPPLPDSNNALAYKYNININVSAYPLGTNFTSGLNIYVYRDIGAFNADISGTNQYNYVYSSAALIDISNVSLSFQTYQTSSIQTYYIIVKAQSATPSLVNYLISPYFVDTTYITLTDTLIGFNPLADPQQNLNNFLYSRSYDTNYLALPCYSNLYQQNPVSNNLFPDISYNDVPMGHDINDVSTDLTHYIGYIQNQPLSNNLCNAVFHLDPMNQYIFKMQGTYNSTTQTYFYTNSSNKLYTPLSVSPYVPSTPIYREYTQAHYYATHFLSNSLNQPPLETYYTASFCTSINSNTYSGTLNGYQLDLSGNVQFGNGIYGISLIPGQGTWDIQRYMFKSVFNQASWTQSNIYNYSSDPNLNIQHLGIYYANVIKNKDITNINIKDSIAVLSFSSYQVYNSSNTSFGFGSEGGTYYEYIRDNNYRTDYYSYLYGFTENSNTITNDSNNSYILIGFDSNLVVQPFIGLEGSIVPYPYYSDAVASSAYLDGTTLTNGDSLIVPQVKANPDSNRGPPSGYNQTQSQIEQSMPIGTTFQAYASNAFLRTSELYQYPNIGTTTDKIIMDISGYMLTQSSDFRLYSHVHDSLSRQFNFITSFTTDEICPNATLLATAANEYEYAFLGLSNTSTFIINTYNPVSQTIQTKQNISYINNFYTNGTVGSFTYNNFGGFTLSITDVSNNKNIVLSAKEGYSNINYDWNDSNVLKTIVQSSNLILNLSEPANYLYYKTYQSPKENLGRFYVSIYLSNQGFNSLYYIDPTIISNYTNVSQITKKMDASVSYSNVGFTIGTANIAKTTAIQFESGQAFDQLALLRAPVQDVFYGFKNSQPSTFSQLTTLVPGVAPYDYTQTVVQASVSTSLKVYEMEAGYNGALWFSDLSGNIFGNRNNIYDGINNKLIYAQQIFYPVQRVIYKNIAKAVNLMKDLSGLQYPEFAHTQLFFYKDTNSFITDLSNSPDISPWGNESNYYISDTHYSGYYFNAYSTCLPLTSNNDYCYLALRNYSPTEKSQVYVRLSLANRYDYGYATIKDISNETLLCSTNTELFNPNYASNLSYFNNFFIFSSKTFGANIIPGYYGITLTNVTGFGDFMKYFNLYYNKYSSNIGLLNTINNNVNTQLSNFIATDLQYILPATATNRQRFTDPLLFSILWKTSLQSQYVTLEDNWGLGWNLGYEKKDTPYDVIQTATSFFKILDDYITLRLSGEVDINRVDTTAKEDLSATHESTGETKAYYGKLLLAPFGSYAQTMIMNPISFNPTLGSLDKLTFTWYDIANNVIDNSDCEWHAVIQIVETAHIVQIQQPQIIKY